MRLIDADKFNKFLLDEYHGMISDESMKIYKILRLIDEQPTVDAEPVRHGKWVLIEDMYDDHWQCSACGIEWTFIDGTAMENGAYYCPHCGAKLDWRNDDDSERSDRGY